MLRMIFLLLSIAQCQARFEVAKRLALKKHKMVEDRLIQGHPDLPWPPGYSPAHFANSNGIEIEFELSSGLRPKQQLDLDSFFDPVQDGWRLYSYDVEGMSLMRFRRDKSGRYAEFSILYTPNVGYERRVKGISSALTKALSTCF